jgi:hypothetical protein
MVRRHSHKGQLITMGKSYKIEPREHDDLANSYVHNVLYTRRGRLLVKRLDGGQLEARRTLACDEYMLATARGHIIKT